MKQMEQSQAAPQAMHRMLARKVMLGLALGSVLAATTAQATVVEEDYRGTYQSTLHTGTTNTASPGHYLNGPASAPVDGMANLQAIATNPVANAITRPGNTNGYYNVVSGGGLNYAPNTMCNLDAIGGNSGSQACSEHRTGKVIYARVRMPSAGQYTVYAVHDDQVDLDLSQDYANTNFRSANYNIPVGQAGAWTNIYVDPAAPGAGATVAAGAGNSDNLGTFNVTTPGSCALVRVYWNNTNGRNFLSLWWSVDGGPTVLVPASALYDPSAAPPATGPDSCDGAFNVPSNTITLRKHVDGRVNAADQFNVRITNNNGNTIHAQATTTGALTDANVTYQGTAGTTYYLRELMASGSTSALSAYTQTASCIRYASAADTVGTSFTPTTAGTGWSVSTLAGGTQRLDCTITNTPNRPVLTLSKTANKTAAAIGEQITYALQLSNTGTAASTNPTTVVDSVPAGLSITSVTAGTNWNCSPATLVGPGDLTCTRTVVIPANTPNQAVATIIATKTGTGDVANPAKVTAGDANCTGSTPYPRCSDVATVNNIPVYNVTATANPAGAGVVNSGSTNCSPSPVANGVTSTCTVTSTTGGWTFTGWTGATCTGGQVSPSCAVVPNGADVVVVANFSPNPGTLTVTKTLTGTTFGSDTAYPFTVSCQNPVNTYNGTAAVSAGNTSGTGTVGIPAGSTACLITETIANRPTAPANYSWGDPEYVQPAATAMAAGGTASGSITNPLTRNQISVTINKTVTGAPTAGAPGNYGFTLTCDTGSYSGTVNIAGTGTTGSATVQVPQGAICTALAETSKAPAPTNYSWGSESTSPPTGAIAAGATGSITNPLTRNQVAVAVTKSVTGLPAGMGAPGSYAFSVSCASPDTGAYTGSVTLAGTGTTGSTSINVPAGATACAITETSKATAPDGYNWGAVDLGNPLPSPIVAGSTPAVTVTNPLKKNAHITLVKTGPDTVLTNQSFDYTLTLTNTGETDSGTDLVVQDQLPAGMVATAVSGANCGTLPSAPGALLTCTVPGPLTAAGGASFTVTVTAPNASGPVTNYAATSPAGSGNPASPPNACEPATTSCASKETAVNTPAAITVAKAEPTITPTSTLNQYQASYVVEVHNAGGTPSTYTLSDTPGFSSSATLVSWTVDSVDGGIVNTSLPGTPSGQISEPNVVIAGGATHTYTVTITYMVTGSTALVCTSTSGNGAFNTATVTGAAVAGGSASASSCGDLQAQATASVTLTKAWTNGKTSDAVNLAITGAVTGATAGGSTVGGASTNATAVATVGGMVNIAETWANGSSANYNVSYQCDNGLGAVSSFTMPNAAVTCTITNARKSAQLRLAKQWVNATAGEQVTITGAYNSTSATVTSTAGSTNHTDTGTSTATVYAGDVITLPTETFVTPANADKYSKTVSCSSGSMSGMSLTVPASSEELLCTYQNSGLPQVSATKSVSSNLLVKGAANQSYTITVTVAQAPTTAAIEIADALPSGIKLSGAPTVAAGTGTSVPKLDSCGALGDADLGDSCELSGTADASLAPGTYIVTIPIDSSNATTGPTAGKNTAHLTGGGDPTCVADDDGTPCNPTTGDVAVNTAATITTVKALTSINGQPATAGALVKAGDVLVYTITSTNAGQTNGLTTLTEQVPAQTSYTGPDGDAWTDCAADAAAGTACTASQSVPANSSASTTFTVTVATPASGVIGNTVTSTADSTCASCTTSNPVGVPHIVLTKSVTTSPMVVGVGNSYKLEVKNTGNAVNSQDIVVSDTIPASLTIGTLQMGCVLDSGNAQKVNCTIAAGALAATTGVTSFTIPVTPTAVGPVSNTATASGGGDPACTAANDCTSTVPNTPVNTPSTLTVVKTNGASQLTTGAQTTYTITITNNGGTAATGVEWTDVVGSGLTGIASIANGTASTGSDLGTCTGLSCAGIIVAPNGGTVTYTVTGTVGAAGGNAVNTARVTSGGACTAQAPCTSTDTDPIVPVPPVVTDPPFITKAAAHIANPEGVKWTIVLDNPNPAAMVVQMRDPMPADMTFISGSVACTASGTGTSVTACSYDTANNRLVVDATLGANGGKVTAVFDAKFTSTPVTVTNTAQACWDQQNDAGGINSCARSVSGQATYTPATAPKAPTPVPVDARWMLALMALLLAGAAARRMSRR